MKPISKLYLALPLILIVLLMDSCDSFFNCIDGNGIQGTEQRIPETFTGVENTTAYDVEVMYDKEPGIVVFADENLLSFIKTEVDNNDNLVISVEYNRCLNSGNPISIEVHMPYIDRIESTGSGNMQVNNFYIDDLEVINSGSGKIMAWNFECNNLDISNSGSGDIRITDIFCDQQANITLTGSGNVVLTGNADNGIYLLTGSGSILASEYPLNICSVSNSGSGDVFCYVHQSLNMVLTGSGDIFYSGSPADIHQIVTGSGSVLPN